MADSGADLVLCQHSHCVGCYEKHGESHILYGQGNYHFVKPNSVPVPESWNGALAVHYDTKSNEIEFTPFVNTAEGIELAKGAEKEKMMSEFAARNESLKNGEWLTGWREFCNSVKDFYIGVIKNACNDSSTERDNAMFAHYLDCEAHTDVWRELFPTYNQTNEK